MHNSWIAAAQPVLRKTPFEPPPHEDIEPEVAKLPLFRQEAIDARRGQWLGSINIATPLSHWTLTLLAVVVGAGIIALLVFGHYTRRETVVGQLVPSTGLLGVIAVNAGTVSEVYVHEGQTVEQGDPLLKISSELDSAKLGNTRAQISDQLRGQRERLQSDLITQQQRADQQAQALRDTLHLLEAEQRQIDAQLKLQGKQVESAQSLLQRIQPLLAKGYISAVSVQQHEAAALSAEAGLKALKRQRLDSGRQLLDARQQLAQLPLDLATQRNDISSKIADIDQQLARNEAQRAIVLHAPRAGVITTSLLKQGQHVAAGDALLSILPKGATLLAQLMVPSRAVGFIEPGSRVVLRYQAFPYQKFGQQYGHVASISRSALDPSAVAALTGQRAEQPLYRIKVTLDRQNILAYGEAQALKPGMALSADVLMDRRSLLEWVFEPIYGLGRNMRAEGPTRG